MKIKKFVDVGMNRSNNYVIEHNGRIAIVDAGYTLDELVEFIRQNGYSVDFCLLTHGHFDHIIGIRKISDKFKCPIYIHQDDFHMLGEDLINMYAYCKSDYKHDVPKSCSDWINSAEDLNIVKINENTKLNLEHLKIKVIHTPGHTSGSVCYLIQECLFSGDTIFKNATGRTDLPTSDPKKLVLSIKEKILCLPDQITIYPGHGLNTTIGNERKNFSNSFVFTKT